MRVYDLRRRRVSELVSRRKIHKFTKSGREIRRYFFVFQVVVAVIQDLLLFNYFIFRSVVFLWLGWAWEWKFLHNFYFFFNFALQHSSMQRFGLVVSGLGSTNDCPTNLTPSNDYQRERTEVTWNSDVPELQSQFQIHANAETVPHTTLAPIAEWFRLSVRLGANLLDKRRHRLMDTLVLLCWRANLWSSFTNTSRQASLESSLHPAECICNLS